MIVRRNRPLNIDEALRLENCHRPRLTASRRTDSRAQGSVGCQLQLSAATLVPRPAPKPWSTQPSKCSMLAPRPDLAPRIADIATVRRHFFAGAVVRIADRLASHPTSAGWRCEPSSLNAARLGFAPARCSSPATMPAALFGRLRADRVEPPISLRRNRGLATEFRDHDPPRALDGGSYCYERLRSLIPQAARLLAPARAHRVVVHGQHALQ